MTIQAAMRGKLAREKAKKVKKAHLVVRKRVFRKVMRQRLMNTLEKVWFEMRRRIVRI